MSGLRRIRADEIVTQDLGQQPAGLPHLGIISVLAGGVQRDFGILDPHKV
jgi:hypothetical protein